MNARSTEPTPTHGWLDSLFLKRLVATPPGRAFLLNFMADAEVSDEGMVFDELLSRVDDPVLHRMVRVHGDDEKRHYAMLRACVDKTGVVPGPVPSELRIANEMDRQLGGIALSFVEGRGSVMEAYVLLLVLEERAVRQFPHIARALAAVDPESAEVVAEVLRDEQRHVLYARAISKKFAPDAATLDAAVTHFRDVERRVYAEHGRAMMRHAVRHGLLDVRGAERLFWRAMAALGGLGRRARVEEPEPAITFA